jgi:diacylglycerol kinase family enzyme
MGNDHLKPLFRRLDRFVQQFLQGIRLGAASAVVILNYRSGQQDKRKIVPLLASIAAQLGVKCDFVLAKTPEHMARVAREAVTDIVIAGGGDGTINAVASQVIDTEKRLGVLPLGTFNYFARELGIPTDIGQAFEACFEGDTRPVTVGEVNGRIFLNNASVGLYPLILSAREQLYRRWGRHWLGAYCSVVETVLRRHANLRLTLTVDGDRRIVRTPLMFIARNSYQLEQFNVPGLHCVAGDSFSVFILRPMNRLRLMEVAFRALTRKLQPCDFDVICTQRLLVESRRIGRTVAFDGERTKMIAPLDFRIREQALRVAVPKPATDEMVA